MSVLNYFQNNPNNLQPIVEKDTLPDGPVSTTLTPQVSNQAHIAKLKHRVTAIRCNLPTALLYFKF